MSATGHNLRRRKAGAARVMELLGPDPDIAEFCARFKIAGSVTSLEQLRARLESRGDINGIAVLLEEKPVRQLSKPKGKADEGKQQEEKKEEAKPETETKEPAAPATPPAAEKPKAPPKKAAAKKTAKKAAKPKGKADE